MWVNNKKARAIKRRIRSDGEVSSYSEVVLMRKSGEDSRKLLQAGFVWIAAPELLALSLYFFPRMIPSTFENEAGREKRYAQMSQLRAKAVLNLLKDVDTQAMRKGKPGRLGTAKRAHAEALLRASSSTAALATLETYTGAGGDDPKQRERTKRAPFKGLPGKELVAAVTVIGVSGPLLRFMRLSALKRHLTQLATEDEVLGRTKLATLSRDDLLEACFDRGLGTLHAPPEELRVNLAAWLSLVSTPREDVDPLRLRLSALATCAVYSVRRGDNFPLSRMLYAP